MWSQELADINTFLVTKLHNSKGTPLFSFKENSIPISGEKIPPHQNLTQEWSSNHLMKSSAHLPYQDA